jgi:hypothetical protein
MGGGETCSLVFEAPIMSSPPLYQSRCGDSGPLSVRVSGLIQYYLRRGMPGPFFRKGALAYGALRL